MSKLFEDQEQLMMCDSCLFGTKACSHTGPLRIRFKIPDQNQNQNHTNYTWQAWQEFVLTTLATRKHMLEIGRGAQIV